MTSDTHEHHSPGGLYDGFEAYRTPAHDDYRRVFESGLLVLDTNVLLNLYLYTDQTRTDLFAVLEALGDRLWIPHQVLAEFWRNRERALRDPRETRRAIASLERAHGTASTALRTWARRVSLPDDRAQEIAHALERGFSSAIEHVAAFGDASASAAAADTGADPVLRRLAPLLDGRVGAPPSAARCAQAVEEARRRIEQKRPPGYLDKSKDGDRALGDYLLWEQLLAEAARRKGDVAFVTGDVKEDWWRYGERGPLGPRPELVDELREHSGGQLFMLTAHALLDVARTLLSLPVHEESVAVAEEVDRIRAMHDLGDEVDDFEEDAVDPDDVVLYWIEYLSPSARKLFRAAASIELTHGPGYTFDDLAANLSISYESVRSHHRNSGRTARRWREEVGREEPIRLEWIEYVEDEEHGGMRTTYALPADVAEIVRDLPLGAT